MAKKLRRKDLKRPDEFVSRTMLAGQWIREHQRVVTFAAVALVVVVVAVTLAVHLSQRARATSSDATWTALDLLGAPVTGERAEDEEDREPPRGYKVFATREARTKAAVAAFERVVEEHGGTAAGQAGLLSLGSALFTQGEHAKAREAFQGFLDRPAGLEPLVPIALEGLGYCLEAEESYDGALERFRDLEKVDNGRYRDLAQYHQGRMLEKLSKNSDAADQYRAVVRRAEQATDDAETNLFVRDRAESRLAVLDPGSDLLKARSKRSGADLVRQILGGQGGELPPGLNLGTGGEEP